jgi:glutamate-1-semialdehyde aminotransferase
MMLPQSPVWYPNSQYYLAYARKVTPCGSQTLSKRAESFVEGAYPCFLSSGIGPYVWDVDHNKYFDLICGLGCMTLGYHRPEVDNAIRKQLLNGVSFSLPTTLESQVAERLVNSIPCAEQVRFTKTGSDACSGAVRIARMATGREKVFYCGYHGWHDGYTSTQSYRAGIPQAYQESNLLFPYNDLFALDQLLQMHKDEVAAIMMEPMLLEEPGPGYLQAVVDLAHDHGTLVIFDEMIMAGRWAFAGGQSYFGVNGVDLATYGKFLGNGMPLACIAGPEEIMKYAWVVSGTFGGETLSLAACDAVLDVYAIEDPVKIQWERGNQLIQGIKECFDGYGILADIIGHAVHPKISFYDDPDRIQMSILIQELARHQVLMHPGGINISAALTEQDVDEIIDAFGQVCKGSFNSSILQGKPYRDALRLIV